EPVEKLTGASFDGEWSDTGYTDASRVQAAIASRLSASKVGRHVILNGLVYDATALEHVRRLGLSPRDVTESADGISSAASFLTRFNGNVYEVECGLNCFTFGSSATTASSGANAVFSGGASPSSGSQISLVDSVFVLSLPNGVTLAPYHRCDQQALRYVR